MVVVRSLDVCWVVALSLAFELLEWTYIPVVGFEVGFSGISCDSVAGVVFDIIVCVVPVACAGVILGLVVDTMPISIVSNLILAKENIFYHVTNSNI